MTVRTPPAYLQAGSHPAEDVRLLTQSLLRSAQGSFAGGVSAADAGHGVAFTNDMAVTQNGTPNMSVNVAAGTAFVKGTESAVQGVYHVVNDATLNLAIPAADATNPRRDLIIVQVRDSAYSGADDDARLTVVTGTPAASPSDPSLTSYPNALVLARVEVDASASAGASSITTSDITDLRPVAGRVGVELRRAATQSIASGNTAWTNFSWDTEDYDPFGFISATSSTLTVPTGLDGVYAITLQTSNGMPLNGSAGGLRVVANGITYTWGTLQFSGPAAVGMGPGSLAVPAVRLEAGDTVTAGMFQASGSSQNVTARLTMYRIML